MGTKAEQKREYIIEQAEKVFAEKGFKNVTMKDIVLACGISRGGVYLYFASTAEVFEAVLRLRLQHEQALEVAQLLPARSATQQLRAFLEAQKNELLNPSTSLIVATYEYLFAQGDARNKAELESKFKGAVKQLSSLIRRGVKNGEFFAEPCAAAQNIVLVLEGLRISSTVLNFDADFLDKQMAYILLQLQGGGQNGTQK